MIVPRTDRALSVQKEIEQDNPGATIMPIIISSDKTQVTLFRNKAAYPVYITIGNLPKDIRSKPSQGGQVLLAYLPTTKLEHIKNKAARRRTQANLFHACLRMILKPLCNAGVQGLPMTSGDGLTRRVHPVFSVYVGDYPEQVLVTCVKSGDCPICLSPRDALGDLDQEHPMRDINDVLDALATVETSTTAEYTKACQDVGIKPVYKPFWEQLPYSNVYLAIAPDILHQLLQGVIKHLVSWVKEAYSEDEIDARCRRLPPNHNVRLFFKGLMTLSRLTGREHSDICRILLGLVIDMRLPGGMSPTRLVRAVRALLDFVYLAQYPVHSKATLDALDDALRRFHENKEIFVDLGIREHFHFPKLHFARHYRYLIELLGAADNFNTEYTERLHIDLAKEAYRATNRKDEYVQMTLWLERKEKILRHDRYIKWCQTGRPALQTINELHQYTISHIFMTREPSAKAMPFGRLATEYGVENFAKRLAEFAVRHTHPELSSAQVRDSADLLRLEFDRVAVYHKAKFWESTFARYRHASDDYDVIHAKPARHDKRGRTVPGQFDTALVNFDGSGRSVGVRGTY